MRVKDRMGPTSITGNKSTGQVLAGLLRQGRLVLVPFGDGHRYDLAFEDDGVLRRVQCKTARLRRGAVEFPTSSTDRITQERKDYRGSVDYFGVYCPMLNKTYLVPVNEVGLVSGSLRVTASKNGQVRGVRLAAHYEI